MRRPRGRAAIRRRCGSSAAGWSGRASRRSGRTAAGCCCPGTYAQIREDAEGLAGQGVTELFYDLNWDPQIGVARRRPGRGHGPGDRDPGARWPPASLAVVPVASQTRASRAQQPVAVRDGGGLGPAGGAQLAQDVGHVHAGRLGRDEQRARRSPGWSGRPRAAAAPPPRARSARPAARARAAAAARPASPVRPARAGGRGRPGPGAAARRRAGRRRPRRAATGAGPRPGGPPRPAPRPAAIGTGPPRSRSRGRTASSTACQAAGSLSPAARRHSASALASQPRPSTPSELAGRPSLPAAGPGELDHPVGLADRARRPARCRRRSGRPPPGRPGRPATRRRPG